VGLSVVEVSAVCGLGGECSPVRCDYPIVMSKGRTFGCGRCFSCKIQKKKIWTHRIMLEAMQYSENAFVTLTYSDDRLPDGNSLCPDHMRDYVKRLRWKYAPHRFRFYGVGEYGETTERPHYHLALFGLPQCERGITRVSRSGTPCCSVCQLHIETWGFGQVYLGTLTDQSAAYVSGYVVKKMTSDDDPRLDGRHPEFARMSNRPGIGAGMMDDMASTLMENRLEDIEDVPNALRHGKRILPLGRYLTRRLRTRIGRDANTPETVLKAREEDMQALWLASTVDAPAGFKGHAFREAVIKSTEGVRARLGAREKRFRKKGSI